MNDTYGGFIDEAQEAIRWRPILNLLREAREAPPGVAKLAAIRNVAEFALRTLGPHDPQTLPAFRVFSLVVELAQTDPRVSALVESLTTPAQ